ncbi:MAG: TIGR00730 family Rossman fold protein [Candidatus Solibacter usitatus]|nr:TIGR00730 family Rossman fold protein [Candidatus Solibacter usitatus]
MKRVCVFCASSMGTEAAFSAAAREMGETLVHRNLALLYGGAGVGLMGLIADTVLKHGGHVHGVIPRSMVDREIAHRGLTHLDVVETMHQRKARMADLSDAFIAMPGAYGTLDELFEILTWKQLGLHNKPVGILNVDGYFDGLLEFLDHPSAPGPVAAPRHPHNAQL